MGHGIPYQAAYEAYLRAEQHQNPREIERDTLLRAFHPDYRADARIRLKVGPNRGDECPVELAPLLQSAAIVGDRDFATAEVVTTDVLVIGGGGAGCAAALSAAEHGARVVLATKLKLGDSNTVMAEGGIQAAVGADDSLQQHFRDSLKVGHYRSDRGLLAQLVSDGPAVIQWLIDLGVQFDVENDAAGKTFRRKRGGGATVPRILSFRDFTGLEMMRVLREAVYLEPKITTWNRCPAVELLTDDHGECVGAMIYDLNAEKFVAVQAPTVILATGGSGRLHLNGFPTSNHYGATADGIVLSYRVGARLREIDSFQYHPTGLAHPAYLAGTLVSEVVRSLGAILLNGLGERFIDELAPRDLIAAAILRECAEGRGVEIEGQVGVFLDTPRLAAAKPGIFETDLISLAHTAKRCAIDLQSTPLIVHPTLHYQNGGVTIDGSGRTDVSGLVCVGEVSGGVHGRNRMPGNSLLELFSFGRRAGIYASDVAGQRKVRQAGIGHIDRWHKELTSAGLPLDLKGPALFPTYGNVRIAGTKTFSDPV